MWPNMYFKSIRRIFTLWLYTGVFLVLLPVSLPSAPKSAERPWQNRIVVKKAEDATVYVWDSQLLLDRSKIDWTFWKQFHPHGINRLLLSLDGQQIKDLAFQENKTDLLNFIARAGEKNIRVELLLGEPLWILPKYRRDLLGIIQELEDIPFTGLHLDLEPNQLDQARDDNKYLLTQLVHTLQSVKSVSPWPVGLSIHP